MGELHSELQQFATLLGKEKELFKSQVKVSAVQGKLNENKVTGTTHQQLHSCLLGWDVTVSPPVWQAGSGLCL